MLWQKYIGGENSELLGFECIYLDDFVLPEKEWLSRDNAAFPFEYIHYDEFLRAVTDLYTKGICNYDPFDWSELAISKKSKTVRVDNHIIIEGVSSLNPVLQSLYALKIFVDSDRSTCLEFAISRGAGLWEKEWQNLFLPSADIYMKTQPELRADLIISGRGASFNPSSSPV